MKKISIPVVLFVFALTAKAQQTLSLKNVLDSISNNSKNLQRYDAEVRSLNEAAKGAYSWMPPELGTGFWMTPYNPKLWKKSDNGTTGMGQYMISAQQFLPNRKRQYAEYNYMQAMSSVTKEEKESTRNFLLSEAKKNYYQWVMAEKKLKVLDENEKLIDFMIKSAEIRYKNGIGKINAYYKAKAALGNIHNIKLMLQNEIAQRRILLNTLMYRDRNNFFTIDTVILLKDYSNIPLDTSNIAASRSDIRAIERNIEITGLQQDLERAKLKPEFGLRFDHMFGFGGFPQQFTLMAMAKIPFVRWSAKGNRATIESLRWKAEGLQQERTAATNEALGMAYSMKTMIETKTKQLKVYEQEIIPALRRDYQTMQLAYQQNTEELFILYDAWEKLNNAQQEYFDVMQQLLISQAELDRILEIKE
jgi:outer membrane protein TolC